MCTSLGLLSYNVQLPGSICNNVWVWNHVFISCNATSSEVKDTMSDAM